MNMTSYTTDLVLRGRVIRQNNGVYVLQLNGKDKEGGRQTYPFYVHPSSYWWLDAEFKELGRHQALYVDEVLVHDVEVEADFDGFDGCNSFTINGVEVSFLPEEEIIAHSKAMECCYA